MKKTILVRIAICACLLVVIGYVILSQAQQKPHQPKSISTYEAPPMVGLLPHGEVKDGLAAFLLCHRYHFKVGEPIPLTYGIINVGPGLEMETTLQESSENANLETRVWCLPNEPGERFSYTWYEVTGPNGQNVPYRGIIEGTLPSSAPLDEFSVLLHHRQFIGTVDPDLSGWLTSDLYDLEDIFFDFDLSKPGTYEVQWGYDARFEGGPWTGELMSNKVKFKIMK